MQEAVGARLVTQVKLPLKLLLSAIRLFDTRSKNMKSNLVWAAVLSTTIFAWGCSRSHDDTKSQSTAASPNQVPANPPGISLLVSTGGYHACALDSGAVHCWGGDHVGQISEMPPLTNPTRISAGMVHSCALDANGVHCWGFDKFGQVSKMPRLVWPTQVSAGSTSTCAIDVSGAHCWGSDDKGQVSKLPALINPSQVSVGNGQACALDATGVHCWGQDDYGQASKIPPLVNPIQVSAGNDVTCALDVNGVHCWGSDVFGEVNKIPQLRNPKQVSVGDNDVCALDATGVHCWGDDSSNVVSKIPVLVNPTQVAAGSNFACAVDAGGVQCWGNDGDIPGQPKPTGGRVSKNPYLPGGPFSKSPTQPKVYGLKDVRTAACSNSKGESFSLDRSKGTAAAVIAGFSLDNTNINGERTSIDDEDKTAIDFGLGAALYSVVQSAMTNANGQVDAFVGLAMIPGRPLSVNSDMFLYANFNQWQGVSIKSDMKCHFGF